MAFRFPADMLHLISRQASEHTPLSRSFAAISPTSAWNPLLWLCLLVLTNQGAWMSQEPPDGPKKASISFRIEGEVAELFINTRDAARKKADYWAFARLTKADFARKLLMEGLVPLARELGVLDEDA